MTFGRGTTTPPTGPNPGAAAGGQTAAAEEIPSCDFSFIYTASELEIAGLPATSPWAEKHGCAARERRADIWGCFARPGKAEAYVYPKCRDGRVVADVVRMDKGHTEGLEPNVVEEIVKLMMAAPGGNERGRK